MEAGDQEQGVFFDYKKQRIGKAAQMRAADVLVRDGELPGILADALDQSVNRLAETPPQAGRFAFVPVLRLNQLRAGGRRENDRLHLRTTLFEFSFEGGPRYAVAPVLTQ